MYLLSLGQLKALREYHECAERCKSFKESLKLNGIYADKRSVVRVRWSASLICFLFVCRCFAGDRNQSWVGVSTANFEVYTTADEDAGRGIVLRLERLRAVLQPALGWRGEQRSDVRDGSQRPVCVIAFGSRGEFQPYAPISRSIGFFLPGRQHYFLVLDGASTESRAASHEFVHLVLSRSGYWLPAWLNEGLAELYSNLEEARSEPRMALGRLIPGRVLALGRDDWIGLTDLVAADAQSEIFTDPHSVDAAYSESWLLAHMLVLDRRYADKFPALLEALQSLRTPTIRFSLSQITGVSTCRACFSLPPGRQPSGLETAQAFQQVYGKPLADVESDLRHYLDVAQENVRNLGDPPDLTGLRIAVDRDADLGGRMALAEMLENYRGRAEQSRDIYRQLARDYPRLFVP
jgi:hypothetical protein